MFDRGPNVDMVAVTRHPNRRCLLHGCRLGRVGRSLVREMPDGFSLGLTDASASNNSERKDG